MTLIDVIAISCLVGMFWLIGWAIAEYFEPHMPWDDEQ
jgi:hypothetical protein